MTAYERVGTEYGLVSTVFEPYKSDWDMADGYTSSEMDFECLQSNLS